MVKPVSRMNPTPLTRSRCPLLCLALLFLSACSHPEATIDVDPSIRLQTMTGWEVVPQAGQEEAITAFTAVRDTLFKRVISEVGINRVRLEITSGAENPVDAFARFLNGDISFTQFHSHMYQIVNDDDDPFHINPDGFGFSRLDYTIDQVVLPLKHAMEANGEHLFINLNYVDFESSDFEHTQSAEEYAEFMLATFQHIDQRYGWVPDAIEVILEPDNTPNWVSGRFIGDAIVATSRRLKQHGYTPTFIAPSTMDSGEASRYFDDMVAVPGVLPHLRELSYHRYSGVSAKHLQAIAARATRYGLSTAMLEWWERSNTGATLFEDVGEVNNSAWQRGTLAWPLSDYQDPTTLYYIDDRQNGHKPQLVMAPQTRYLRQIFRAVRLGAVRYRAVSSNPVFTPLAFENTDGSQVLVVRATRGGTLYLNGLPGGDYHIRYTTDDEDDVELPAIRVTPGVSVQTGIPAAGIITLHTNRL